MDANGNQRKRGRSFAKNANTSDGMLPPQSNEQNEVIDVSAVAISPTLEEVEPPTNAPASECRRSSRKKIIKFDVRDLLNKNRKTHKIQIEARIDSNAPTTSKAATAGGTELVNPKTSSTVRDELLSKQKTFLEKSAIFRRYSISQDHKPPPPPLPMPPLLSKGNDNKDVGHSGNNNARRLSRTQEFFSNVMIKPKQTTSLIVAQIESNTPSSSATAKRRSLNKSLELEAKVISSSETEYSPVVQQRKRGRPAKCKPQTSVDAVPSSAVQEDATNKKITPEKAKNWKEYKACLAEQTSTPIEDPTAAPSKLQQVKVTKLESLMNLEETQQSDISKSEDDDGNFSGFKSSKEDLSCDSPVLEKEKLSDFKGTLNKAETRKNVKTKTSALAKEKQTTSKANLMKTEAIAKGLAREKVADTKQTGKERKSSLKTEQVLAEETPMKEIISLNEPELETPSTAKVDTKSIKSKKELAELPIHQESDKKIDEITTGTETKIEQQPSKHTITSKKEEQIGSIDKTVLQEGKEVKESLPIKRSTRNSPELFEKKDTEIKSEGIKRSTRKSPELFEKKDTEIKSEGITRRSRTKIEREESLEIGESPKEDVNVEMANQDDAKSETTASSVREGTETTDNEISKLLIRTTPRQLGKEDTKDSATESVEIEDDKAIATETKTDENVQKISLETLQPTTIEAEQLETPEVLSKAAEKILDECTPQTELSSNDILLLTSQLSAISQTSTPTEETIKSSSRTSSSSESENASERSSYSSDPSSTPSSSSSARSYKSGDKLRVSLKRISLPKSPSTSSQTSTSEELNSSQNLDVLKKKPPLGKRSKRIQKKCVDMMENKDVTANIDESFRSTTSEENEEAVTTENHDEKEKLKTDQEVCNEQITLSTDGSTAEVVATASKEKDIVTQPLVDGEATEGRNKNLLSGSNESSNIVTEPVKEKKVQDAGQTIVKRKSLRNRKDNSSSEEKDEDTDKPPVKIKETLQKENISQELEVEKQEEIILQNVPDVENIFELQTVPESDQREEANQPTKQQPQRKPKKQTSSILEKSGDKKEETSTLGDANEPELTRNSNKDQASLKNKSDTEEKSNEFCKSTANRGKSPTEKINESAKCIKIPTTRSKTNKEERADNLAEYEGEEEISCPKQKSDEKNKTCLNILETETSESLPTANKITATRSKTNKEEISLKESKIEEDHLVSLERKDVKLEDSATQSCPKRKSVQRKELNNSADNTSSPKETSIRTVKDACDDKPETSHKLAPTRNKTNQAENLNEKSTDIMLEETGTKRSKSPKDKSTEIYEEPKTLTTRSKVYKEDIYTKGTKVPAENILDKSAQDEDNAKSVSKSDIILEIASETVTKRSKSPKESITKIEDEIKILSTRSKANKEDIAIKESKNPVETPTQGDEKSPEIATKRSRSPKENITKIDEETKILSTRSKTIKEDISTSESKLQTEKLIEKPTQVEVYEEKTPDTVTTRCKSPKENTTKINDETKVLTTRSNVHKEDISSKETNLIEKPTQDENNAKIVSKSTSIQEISSDSATNKSKSPKETSTKIDEEPKVLTTRSKINKQDISTNESKIPADNLIEKPVPVQDYGSVSLVSTSETSESGIQRSKSPEEKSTKIHEETKILSTRSKTNENVISTKESKTQEENLSNTVSDSELLHGKSSETGTKRTKSTKETITISYEEQPKDLQEKSKKFSSPRRKNKNEDNSPIETKNTEQNDLTTISLEAKEQGSTKKSRRKPIGDTNKTEISEEAPVITESTEITEVQEVKTDEIPSTRSKNKNDVTSPNSPTRSKSKKANTLLEQAGESPKPITSTTLIPDMHAESTESSLPVETAENLTTESQQSSQVIHVTLNPEEIPSSSKIMPDLYAELSEISQIVTREASKSPPGKNRPSSAKRKSLRIQKDTSSEESLESTSDTLKQLEENSTTNLQPESVMPKLEQQTKELVKTTKRKGRKSRFKNLHGPEVESETDSSNGKNTPIEEIMQQKHKEEQSATTKEILQQEQQIEQTTEPQELTETVKVSEIEANPTDDQPAEVVGIVKEQSSANLSSSQIQNVSIETNTLLDILRRVQSNTEAALKAVKSQTNISTTDIDYTSESATKQEIEETVNKSQDSNVIAEIQPESLKIAEESKIASPTRSDTESPLTLKKMYLSPARSESASPSTLKKITQSPTRSDSSSPLTLKKVTRRYERRSRRGEDSAHKTLEETFAEIAEQSTKAVLAAKEFDINEEQTAGENAPEELHVDINTETKTQTEDIADIFTKIESTSSDLQEEALHLDEMVDKQEEALPDVSQLAAVIENVPNVIEQVDIEIKTCENVVVEPQETTKVTTPARRGRKPKNRSLEAPGVKTDIEVKQPTESKAETKGVNEEKQIDVEFEEKIEQTPSEDLMQKPENKTNKSKKPKASAPDTSQTEELSGSLGKSSAILETQPDVHSTEISVETQPAMDCSLKLVDETNEGKFSKKSVKKRDTSKGTTEAVTEDSVLSDAATSKDKEDEVRTPKQTTKKRDTSQTKSETKSIAKKLNKKAKNEEEDDNLTKTTPCTVATTPPPSKRGRKPKNQQQETPQTTSGSKKKNKKETTTDPIEDSNEEKRKAADSESESLNSSLDRSMDEKLAKKKRQKKLKEAFEAALTDDIEKATKEALNAETTISTTATNFGLALLNNSPPPERSASTDMADESRKITCVTPIEAEEDPDPLKDIEKFIADGVNLLKKDYKLDEDSVDDVIATTTTPAKITEISEEPVKSGTEDVKPVFNTFETPADTPINTPSVTPPPKSPTSIESSTPDEHAGVRRSHRIKLITKTPKALVGRGLVRDKERFSIKDDVETKSHYTLDDHLTDLAEVEAKNAKFLKEMEERLSNFQVIKENEYLCERVISREARKMICDCFLTHEEEERGELGCGEDCLNRLLMIECGTECNVKERCTNKRFQKLLCSPCRVFRTEKKGFGIMADIEILPGEFILEYVGEVIDTDEFEKRRILYSQDKNRHYYFMALRSDAIIDATIKGNISRFINHSCDPNAETQKWTVNGELRIGFFSRKSIMPGEEITFNYQYQRYGREAQRCYCESANCTGWIGQEPTSDEGEQVDDDDEFEESEDEEEEADTSNLLVQDDDEDSDASVADPEEVQKQLEMAAAQAEVELAPLQLLEQKAKQAVSTIKEGESTLDSNKSETEEDSKSKFKKLLSKMAEKVAAKQKQTKREQKLQRKKKSKESSTDLTNKLRFLEDPDIEDEVEFLKECGLKNQSDTLRLSRLMVRAKLVQTRLNLLEILRQGDLPCRRLFLDYHGLRLVHGWMSEDAGNMQIRLALLKTLDTLPIANKTVLTDSKVMQVVRNWCGHNTNLSPSEDSSSSNSNSQDVPVQTAANFEEGSDLADLQKLALKLITTWEGLPEIFRIPKKERIEQMKEHEREADRQYAANAETQESTTANDRYRRDRFGRGLNTSNTATSSSSRFVKPNNGNPHRTTNTPPENNKNLSKTQRRQMFAAKVARDEAEKRLAEERREFETKCRFFGLDPKKTRHQDIPFCVNPASGQWFSIERKPITTPPSYAHVQVPVKPKSTDPNDYQLPAVCSSLPPQWKYAITAQGKIYYYHIKHRIPQWEPPSPAQLHQCELEAREDDSESELSTTVGEESSDDDDDILIGMDAAQLKAYIDRKVEMRRQKRYQRLVDERCISPRREEDRIYNQIEVRKYKENKEKIRKRKEEIRRKRAEALRQTSLNMCTLGSITEANPNSSTTTNKLPPESDEELGALPIQDYLLSSDEEVDLKAEVNSPLIDKIVEGDKIVDELDALTTKRQLKRPLPPHRDLNEASTSSSPASTSGLSSLIARQEYKKRKLEKKEKRKPKEQDAKYRKNKEKFRCEIAGIIVHHLKPYRKETCTVGRIQSNEDFNHLARKLTHFVMIKELKYCESVGQTLVVTESVKSKSREFIKKYMAKYGDVYVKPSNDPDFKDIPFTL